MSYQEKYKSFQRNIHGLLQRNWVYARFQGKFWFLFVMFFFTLMISTLVNLEVNEISQLFKPFTLFLGILAVALGMTCSISKLLLLRQMRHQFFVIGAAFAVSLITTNAILQWQVAESIAEGDALIIALNQFHQNNHRYPSQLEDLTPKFVAKVPKSRIGVFPRTYEYYTLNGQSGFRLAIGYSDPYLDYSYVSYEGEWKIESD